MSETSTLLHSLISSSNHGDSAFLLKLLTASSSLKLATKHSAKSTTTAQYGTVKSKFITKNRCCFFFRAAGQLLFASSVPVSPVSFVSSHLGRYNGLHSRVATSQLRHGGAGGVVAYLLRDDLSRKRLVSGRGGGLIVSLTYYVIS